MRTGLLPTTISLFTFFIVTLSSANASERVSVLDGYPVTIRYEEGDEKVARKVSSIAMKELPRLARELGAPSMAPVVIFLVGDMTSFERQRGIFLPDWGVAFALMEDQVMLVDVPRATLEWNTLERVIVHELSHLLLAQRLGGVPVPAWFVEGLAMWQAREWSALESWRLMEAVWGNRAPSLGQIHAAVPYDEALARDAYRVAYAGFTQRFDDALDRVPSFLDEVARSKSFAAAFETFWEESEHGYYGRFGRDLERRYKSRLLLFQAGPLFTVAAVLFVFVVLRTHARNRRRLRELEALEGGSLREGS